MNIFQPVNKSFRDSCTCAFFVEHLQPLNTTTWPPCVYVIVHLLFVPSWGLQNEWGQHKAREFLRGSGFYQNAWQWLLSKPSLQTAGRSFWLIFFLTWNSLCSERCITKCDLYLKWPYLNPWLTLPAHPNPSPHLTNCFPTAQWHEVCSPTVACIGSLYVHCMLEYKSIYRCIVIIFMIMIHHNCMC